MQELDAVNEQAVDYSEEAMSGSDFGRGRAGRHTNRDIIHLIQLIYKRADDRDVNAKIPQLLQAHVVLHNRYHIPPNTVDVCIHRQMRVCVDGAREDWLFLDLVTDVLSQ